MPAQKLWRRGGKWVGTRVGWRSGGVWIGGGTATSDTTPPSAVTNLAAAVSGTRVSLTWTAATDNVGVVGHRVLRGGVQIGSTTSPGYVDSDTAENTTYSYVVRAVDGAGLVSADATVSATTGTVSTKIGTLRTPTLAAASWNVPVGASLVDPDRPAAVALAGPIIGAVTSRAVELTAKTGPIAGARYRFPDGTTSATVAPDPVTGWVKLALSGLAAGGRLHGYLELDGAPDVGHPTVVRTHPAGTATRALVAFASCDDSAGAGATTYDRMRAKRPDVLAILGDLDYANIDVNDPQLIRAARERRLDDVALVRALGSSDLVYVWDDHDYARNSGHRGSASRPAVQAVYRQIIPSYPKPADDLAGVPWTAAWAEFTRADLDWRTRYTRLRQWYLQNSGPTVAINTATPLLDPVVVTQADADALAGRLVHGTITVNTATGSAVTLRNFRYKRRKGTDTGSYAINVTTGASVTVEDAEIDGGNDFRMLAAVGGTTTHQATHRRLNIHRCCDGLRLGVQTTAGLPSLVERVYIHDAARWDDAVEGRAYDPATDPRCDGVQATRVEGNTATVRQSFIDLGPTNVAHFGAVFAKADDGPIQHLRVEDSFLNGGQFHAYVHDGATHLVAANAVAFASTVHGPTWGGTGGLWSFVPATRTDVARTGVRRATDLTAAPLTEGALAGAAASPPYTPITELGGIYHSYLIGGGAAPLVEGIVTDLRSYRSPHTDTDGAAKTMLGVDQLAWLRNRIASSPAKLIVWHCSSVWVDNAATLSPDGWAHYRTEQDALAAFIKNSGKRVVIISGDMHALAANDGATSPGGIPVFQAAAVEQTASHKGGPYTHGPVPTTTGGLVRQYGTLLVEHSGTTLTAAFQPRDSNDNVPFTVTRTWTGVAA